MTQSQSTERPRYQRQAEFLNSFAESIWSEFTPLAVRHKAVNLGQGFPDWDPEPFTIKALIEQANSPSHQYARARGDLQLVNAITKLYHDDERGFGRELDPLTNVLVTNGANDGLYISLCSFINPGDEVICIEPYFDVYPTGVAMAGGVPIFVPLRPPEITGPETSAQEWRLDEQELRATITEKTRAIILNTPHNPTGKVFSRSELEMIARVVKEHDMIVFSDEVYEFLVFGDGNVKHERIANIPGMWDKTITICSSSKTFSVTGWKIGWLIGPKEIINSVALFNQYKVFCVATPLQRSIAQCIETAIAENYFSVISNRLKDRYEQLLQLLEKYGLRGIKVHAGYFTLVDISAVDFPYDKDSSVPRDYQFCRWLPGAVGLAAIPTSAFYSDKNKYLAGNYVRFAFCKKADSIESAEEGFKKLQKFLQ